jgi:hypothetical protein
MKSPVDYFPAGSQGAYVFHTSTDGRLEKSVFVAKGKAPTKVGDEAESVAAELTFWRDWVKKQKE